jgi:hypothetical protein
MSERVSGSWSRSRSVVEVLGEQDLRLVELIGDVVGQVDAGDPHPERKHAARLQLDRSVGPGVGVLPATVRVEDLEDRRHGRLAVPGDGRLRAAGEPGGGLGEQDGQHGHPVRPFQADRRSESLVGCHLLRRHGHSPPIFSTQ